MKNTILLPTLFKKIPLKITLATLLILVAVTACATPTPTATPEPAATPVPTDTPVPPPTATPTPLPPTPTPTPVPPLTWEMLQNATYPSELEESGTITLTDGRYEGEPFVEGGASRLIVTLIEPVAFGDLDDDGVDDAAVILASNAGGSGTFIDLTAVLNQDGTPNPVATTPLGDRARPQSMAIESGQIVLEMITHGPDDPMCCPTQIVRNVYALEGDTLIEVSSEVIGTVKEPSQPTAQLTLEALQNASYQGIYDEPVQLTDGQYEGEPFVPGGASRPTVTFHPEVYAFGDLNGDGVDDAAVILIENSGGSGNFLYLAAVINDGGAPVNVATQFVGDREQVQAIIIEDGEITLNMVAHGPDDPMCCPTQEVTKRYQLRDDQLVEVLVGLEGTMWTLVSYGDPSDPQAVLEGSEITAVFDSAEGRVSGSAGCNNYTASYAVEDTAITFGPAATTRKMCAEPEGIMEQESAYLAALASATAYQIEGHELTLTNADGVRVVTFTVFEPQAAGLGVVGTVWQWVGTQTPTEKIAVDDPGKYTIEFLPDGKVNV
ncbi:MAG: META domain-containing protein [Anaerolineae bacterium]